MKNDNKPTSGGLDRTEIEPHLEDCSRCSKRSASIDRMLGSLNSVKDAFCPTPEQLYEFSQTGEDPTGRLAYHLARCESCRNELAEFKSCAVHAEMPERIQALFELHLSKGTSDSPLQEPEGGLSRLAKRIASFLDIKMLSGVAVAAAAALLLLIVYPRGEIETVMGLRSVAWEKTGTKELTWMTPGQKAPAKRPRVAMLILFKGYKKPVSSETIDALYRALQPSKEMRSRFDWLDPAEIKKTLGRGKIKLVDRKEIIQRLRTDLGASQVILLTVVREEKRYRVQGELAASSTGSILKEFKERDVTEAALPSKLRESVRGLLGEGRAK